MAISTSIPLRDMPTKRPEPRSGHCGETSWALKAPRVRKVPKGTRDLKVFKGLKVSRAKQVLPVPRDLKGISGLKVLSVLRAHRVRRGVTGKELITPLPPMVSMTS